MKTTQDRLKTRLQYRSDGQLIWVKPYFRKPQLCGRPLGALESRGYRATQIFGRRYYVHQLVFIYHFGWLPKIIDHINQDKSDNRIENLRPSDNSSNGFNTKLRVDNRSGVRGVCWKSNRWRVCFQVRGREVYLGRFKSKADADRVAKEFLKKSR
jgi:hypothetical protein